MDTINYTDEYNNFMKLSIYEKYKLLIPFVGKNYNTATKKVLFIGESHFLPKQTYNRIDIDEFWYKTEQGYYKFTEEERDYLNTRNIINRDVINSTYQNKSHSIYRNIGIEIANFLGLEDYNKALLQIAFYNYFLRPAEAEGESILDSWNDDVYSFIHLINIEKILKPHAIIFSSKKARQAFHRVRWSEEFKSEGEILEKKVFYIPHPGNAWWNNEFKIDKKGFWNSKINSIEEAKINGRNKLRLILKSL